jgi:hypothetical protein
MGMHKACQVCLLVLGLLACTVLAADRYTDPEGALVCTVPHSTSVLCATQHDSSQVVEQQPVTQVSHSVTAPRRSSGCDFCEGSITVAALHFNMRQCCSDCSNAIALIECQQ